MTATESRSLRKGNRVCWQSSAADGGKTKLKSTTQLSSFIGEDMVKGHETGTNASLDNLVRHFSK